MKNMKIWKCFLAVGMCSAMMFSMSVDAFAAENQDTMEVVAEAETGEKAEDEEDFMPVVEPVTIEYVPGEMAEIPVKKGSDKYEINRVHVSSVGQDLTTVEDGEYDAEKGVVRFKMADGVGRYLDLLEEGDYTLSISFYERFGGAFFTSTDAKIHVGMDSKWPVLKGTSYVTDGSEDLVYQFENGTGLFELKEILSVDFSVDAIVTDGGIIPELTSSRQFSYDIEKGTVTIKGSALRAYNIGDKKLTEDWLYLSFKGKTVNNNIIYGANYGVGNGGNEPNDGDWHLKCEKMLGLSFTDVNPEDWYFDAAGYVFSKGIMTGMNETEFGPSVKLSRGQFATILYRMENEPETWYDAAAFPDVSDGQFYTGPAMWAKDSGVISGYDDGRFGPADEITREQMAVMMFRYADMLGLDTTTRGDMGAFPDADRVSPFADEAVRWAVGMGFIKGDGGFVNPQGTAERAQCATIIMRFMEGYGL